MVAAQVAGSCLLLIVAGMVVRSVHRLLRTDPGFDYERAAVLAMPLDRYGMTGNAAQSYWYAVRDRVNANPEVEGAAIVTAPPLGGRVFETLYDDAPRVKVLSQNVDPEYFGLMRIPIVSGRVFAARETGALVVSRRLALEMYGTVNVLGESFPKTARSGRSSATNVAELRARHRPGNPTRWVHTVQATPRNDVGVRHDGVAAAAAHRRLVLRLLRHLTGGRRR